jgi:hypothetical protein
MNKILKSFNKIVNFNAQWRLYFYSRYVMYYQLHNKSLLTNKKPFWSFYK